MIFTLPIQIFLFLITKRSKKCKKESKTRWNVAWRLLCHRCAKLFEYLKNVITSDSFISNNKISQKNFTRNRKLPFPQLITFLLNLLTGSYQKELDSFFKTLLTLDIAKRVVSKAAFCKARLKLKYEAFIDLNRHLIEFFYKNIAHDLWYGFNLLVIDGSLIRLPKIPKIAEHFGAWHPAKGDYCPMARTLQLFDPLNGLSIRSVIGPKSRGEREMAADLCLNLLPKDLILLDRGFPAYWFFNLILSMGADFCARVPAKKWKIVRKFFYSGKPDVIISLPAHATSVSPCRQMGLDLEPLTLRLIRIDLPSGETEILITSLIDQKLFPYEIFAELYHKRWFVEEDYKKIKCWIEVENFTGKSVLSVYQDFYARVLSKNITAALAYMPNQYVKEMSENNTYQYQINFAYALSAVKQTVVLLFNRPLESARRLIFDLFKIISQTTEPIRPDRKFPRRPKIRKNFYLCYKPIG